MAQSVKLIPDGFHSLTSHLVVRNAHQAIAFYKQAFGAEELNRMPGPDGKVMHAEMKIGEWSIATRTRDLTPEQIQKGAEAYFSSPPAGHK